MVVLHTERRTLLWPWRRRERLSNMSERDSSKALYYTLASSTVLEKTSYCPSSRELDNVFLAAAKYGDLDILLRSLDNHSININVRDDSNGDTALMLAAKSNNAKVVEALVERGADVTILNEEGKSALDLSSNHLKLAVLGKYSKNGDAKHGDGVSIIKAAWQGDADSLKKLLVSNSRSKTRASSLLSKTNHKSDEGLSPLLVATRDVNIFIRLQRSIKLTYEPIKVIQELLRSKADVNAMDLEGHTALHFATRITTQQICREIVDLLLMYRPLVNNLDRTNLAPLHTATSNDNVPVVTALMEAGADPNLHGIGGATALHIGAQQDNEEMVRRLVSAGADINALDSAGMTPLCVARTSKMREFMRSLFMKMVGENGGVPVKLIYDELSNKRTIQKMIETVPSTPVLGPRVTLIDVNEIPPLDLKPLQMKMVQETENLYDYNKNQRVPRPILERSRRQSIGLSSMKKDKKTVEILPRIRQQSPILLLSKGQRPTQDRTLTRFQREQHPGVFLTQRQAKRKTPTKPQPCMTARKPPIPKHTCGFTEPTVVPKSRQGSAKSQCKRVPSRSSNNSGGEADQWLPGCPIIKDTNDSSDAGGTISRPTSAVTTSSNSFKGPKIHLKHVLKNILSTMDGSYTEDLISRYLSQQKPVKVKEMGFVDFLLQDINPDNFSDVSCSTSIPSQHSHHADLSETSSSSVASGFSYQSITGLEEPKYEAPTLPISTVMIGDTSTTDTHQVNLPFLRRPSIPQPFGLRVEIPQDKNLVNIKDLSSSENSSPDLKSKRPDVVPIKPSSLEQFVESNKQTMPVVNLSPFANPDHNLAPKNSSRSSRDSGFGSQATLLSDKRSPVKSDDSGIFAKSQNTKSDESLDTNEEERPVSSVSLGSEMSSDSSIEEKIEPVISVEIKSEEDQKEEPAEKEEEKKEKEVKPEAPVVGIRRNGRESAASIGLLTGMKIKSAPKLLSSRQNNSKVKETPFKRKVYNRKLPQIVEALTEETRTRDGKTLREKNLLTSARLRRQGKSAKGSQSSNSSTKSEKSDPKANRPGTVPSKPDSLSVTVSPSTKNPRPKTSAGIPTSPADDLSDPKKDALLTKISTIKDLDALMYSMPLQIDSDNENTLTPRGINDMSPKGFNDAKSMYSERRSILTDFTGTTKIESIMGDTTQWKKGRLLGAGASGKVWHGVTADKMEVAVKQIELCGDIEDARDEYMKLQEEVRLLKCLKHDNIIRYYGTCLQDSNVNIFMEMVTGGSVSGRLKKEGPFPERLIQNLAYQLLDALRYIHAKNIVHRDIKGQNVLITENDKIKLIDFGCSKRLRRSLKNADALKTFRGTPYWMSPEVIKECGHGTKSDIWSLGCTVYEMLTGNPPWHNLPTMAAMYKIGSGNAVPHYPSNASDYCIDFMKACFIGDPKERPTAEELCEYEFISLYSNRIKAQS